MALTPQQEESFDRAVNYINSKGNITKEWLINHFQLAGMSDARIILLIQSINSERKLSLMTTLKAIRKISKEAGFTDQEWAEITIGEKE